MKKHRIAVIPGDGIGHEVVPEGIRVLDAVGARFGLEFQWDEFPWSCAYFTKTGKMMPEDGLDRIRHHDAIFLGAVGFPGVPETPRESTRRSEAGASKARTASSSSRRVSSRGAGSTGSCVTRSRSRARGRRNT